MDEAKGGGSVTGDNKKRKIRGKRIVFLIFAILFGLIFIVGAVAAIQDLEAVYLIIVSAAPFALFLLLFLRKEPQNPQTYPPPAQRKTPGAPSNYINPLEPSPEKIKWLISTYRKTKKQAERDQIIDSLVFSLFFVPLIFPTDASIPQSIIDSAKDFKPGDTFSLQEQVGGNVMSFQQDGQTYVPAFTDSAAASKSNIPFSISMSMYPSTYLHILINKTYDKIVIDPEDGVAMFAIPKSLFEMLLVMHYPGLGGGAGSEQGGAQPASKGNPANDAEPANPTAPQGNPTNHSVADQPVAGQPAADQPVAGQPAADQPAAGQPAADQPAADQPATGQCCIFGYPTADEAGKSFSFDIIEEYSHSDDTYSWNQCTQRLVKCKNCGALFLQKFYCFKAMRYEDDDKYYTYYYPVDTREEALSYAARDGRSFESSFKGEYIKLINQRWQWNKV